MRPRTSAGIDGEGLQADVMRFMAIIAFCLVAIMALVRDVVPPVESVQTPVQTVPEVPAAKKQVVIPQATPLDSPRRPEVVKQQIAAAKSVAARPVKVAQKEVEQPQVEQPQVEQPQVEQIEISQIEVASTDLERTDLEPTDLGPTKVAPTEVEPIDAAEPGLSLRFGSDQDFLRLIAKGDVGVFLFNERDVYRLEKDYSFARATAPGELYELMPRTIPGAIKAAAENAVSNTDALNWGVVMPERIARRIAALVAVEHTGQLVINRYGEVQHQALKKRSTAGG